MTASRPARAMRGAAVVVALAIAWRVPVVRHDFAVAIAAAGGESPAETRRAPVTQRDRWGVTTASGVSPEGSPGGAVPPTAADGARRRPRASGEPARRRIMRREERGSAGSVGKAPTSPAAPAGLAPDVAPASPAVEIATAPPQRIGAARPARPARPPVPFDLATAAYARLAAGDRRGAVRLFDAALAGDDDPRDMAWRRQRDALTRHWSATAFSLVRADGAGGAAVTPVLGGGQSGAGVGYTLDPLARRPVALTVRGTVAHDDGGRTAFAAVGVQWRLLPGVSVVAERLVGIGPAAPGEWTVRLAAGTDRHLLGRLLFAGYAEGGVIGSAGYAAGQARIGPELHTGGLTFEPGVGGWASAQRDRGRTVDRLDLGPGIAARAGPFAAALDYRLRVAGNATPGTGPVLTLSAAY